MGLFHKVLHSLTASKAADKPTGSSDRLLAQINRFASLIRLQDERKLIEVLIGDRGESFASMIVGVDLYNQQLIIDEFSPRIKNCSDLVGQAVILRHQNKQQMLKVSSEIVKWDAANRCIVLNLPEKVEYQPRREYGRIFLSGAQSVNALVDPIYGAPWHSSVDNISMGGARLLVMGDLRNQLHKNKPLKTIEMKISPQTSIICRAKVKAFSYQSRPFRRTEISIEFEALSNENQRKLENFIEQLSFA